MIHETDNAELGGAVVRLAKVAVKSRSGGCHHDAAVPLVFHHGERGLGDVNRAEKMNSEHEFKIFKGHLQKTLVPQNTCIADEHIYSAKVVERLVDKIIRPLRPARHRRSLRRLRPLLF